MNTEPIYGRLDMTYLLHEKFYGSLGIKIPFVEREAQGESPLLITDAKDNKELLSFIVAGKSIQQTTTGAQLFVSKKSQETIDGMTLTQKDDGGWHLEGTCTADDFRNIRLLEPTEYFTLPSGDYTLSFTGAIPDSVTLSIAKVANVNKQNEQWTVLGSIDKNKRNIAISLDGTEEALSVFVAFPSQVALSFDFYAMLNAGDTVLPWEPYTGGKPSPSPEYKQELVSSGQSGQIKTDVLGGNLLDLSKGRSGTGEEGVTYIKNPDGSYRRTGKATGVNGNAWFLGGYALDPNTPENVLFTLKPGTYTFIDGFVFSNKEARRNTFTTDSDFKVTGVRNPLQELEKTYNDTIYPMLNVGSSALPFEPYKQPQTLILTTPDGLLGIPVSGDNYTYIDSTGQKWIADSIEYRRDGKCVRVQRVKKEVFTNASSYSDKEKCMIISSSEVLSTGQRVKCISDRFVYKSPPEKDEGTIFAFKGVIRLYKNFSGIDEANEWLTKNPVTVIYPLANHIETPLTPEEIAAFKVLHTNEPTTTIMNDAGIWARVRYHGK